MLKNLPIGIQDFKELRERECIYVDKTETLLKLITDGKYYFLSRPRRFGKSLTISTLAEIFEGSKELFEGLYIYDKIEWKKRPVIRVDFTSDSFKKIGLEEAINEMLDKTAKKYDLNLSKESNRGRFGELIEKLHKKNGEKVVVLIDEYDKPIIDYLENIDKGVENREILRDFYGVVKPMDPHLEFVMMTGVSKFSKVSIFSELNNLNDITTSRHYSDIVGLTKEEIDKNFKDYKKIASTALSVSTVELDEKMKFWYDGYSWDHLKWVYNPFSMLKFFHEQVFDNYWFATGTPTFLVNFIRNKGINAINLENTEVDSIFFDKFDIENLDIISLMFQTGYLTIKDKNEYGEFILGYPNEEVRLSMTRSLLEGYTFEVDSNVKTTLNALRESLKSNDISTFYKNINALFASIPNQIFINKQEAYYQSIIYLTLKFLGVYIDCEVSTNRGRIDGVIKTDKYIYIMEFKMAPATPQDALNQIKEKGYHISYQTDNREKYIIGISFDPEKKQLSELEIEKF